jgi:DNA transformation protein
MANSPDFVAHALDLLAAAGPVTARSMFGGHGIYLGGLMFALLDDDELFLKGDEEARPRFEAAGCRQWAYPGPKGLMPMGYWRPPDEAHEEAEAMLPWARLALAAAERKAATKASRAAGRQGKARQAGAPGRRKTGAPKAPAPRKGGAARKGGTVRPAAAGAAARKAAAPQKAAARMALGPGAAERGKPARPLGGRASARPSRRQGR